MAMGRTWAGLRGLGDTREGRLTIIVVVGGSLMVATAFGNVWLANAADDQARHIRATLRAELGGVTDEQIAAYPDSAEAIAGVAVGAIDDDGEPGRLVRVDRPDLDEVVVHVEAGMAWQRRCVEAELRGGGTVLTQSTPGPC
jgi:hypothetical protein